MTYKRYGASTYGVPRAKIGKKTHTEIRQGDIWKDSNGNKIIILAVSPLSVEYRRNGYDETCFCPPDKFLRKFEYVEGNTNESDVTRFMAAADGDEKIQVLREIIQERLKK